MTALVSETLGESRLLGAKVMKWCGKLSGVGMCLFGRDLSGLNLCCMDVTGYCRFVLAV
jgi:hypothetical protein